MKSPLLILLLLALAVPAFAISEANSDRRNDDAEAGPRAESDPFFLFSYEEPDLAADDVRRLYAGGKVAGFRLLDATAESRIDVSNALFRPLRDAFAASEDVATPPGLKPRPVVRVIVPDDLSPFPNEAGFLPEGMTESGYETGVTDAFLGDLFLWRWDGSNCATVVRAPGAARLAEGALSAARVRRVRIEETIRRTVLDRIDLKEASPAEVLAFLAEELAKRGDPAVPEAERGIAFDVAEVHGEPRITVRILEEVPLSDFLDLLADMWLIRWGIEDGVVRARPRRHECFPTIARPAVPHAAGADPKPHAEDAEGAE